MLWVLKSQWEKLNKFSYFSTKTYVVGTQNSHLNNEQLNQFSFFSTKTYVVGTQNKRLNEKN